MKIGVIGLGTMGSTHLDAYTQRDDVEIVAVADLREDRLHGKAKAAGNIEGQAQGGADLSAAKKYREGMDLLRDANVEAVDICLPTPLHRSFTVAALAAGKHVLVEKPLARTADDAFALADIAEKSSHIAMPAMCMRFWPGWDWLKEAVDSQRYGKVLAAQFRRVASHPGGEFYSSGDASGGGALDLHIHDTDFIQYLFGPPPAVFARGYARETNTIDHLVTHYLYDGPLVVAEGGWSMTPGFGFRMQYCVNFERATASFDISAEHPLTLATGGKAEPVPLPKAMGYALEIDYFLGCVRRGEKPTRVTMRDAAVSVAIVEAEVESARAGKPVSPKLR